MPKHHSIAAVIDARRRFRSGNALPANILPPEILASWQRCAELGLSQHERPRSTPIPTTQMHHVFQRHERLLRYAQPEVDALHADVATAGSIVILTGPDGLLLDARGDANFADRAARIALRPGAYWTEEFAGTNAIGTALVEGRPIEVRGPEHYFDPHRILNCVAAPIRSPRGELLGVLDVSGPAALMHLHAPGLVRMAVDQIEHRYFSEDFDACQVVRFHANRTVIGTPREGILIFRDNRLVGANRHALALIKGDWSALDDTRFTDVFADGLAQFADTGEIRDHDGHRFHGSLDRRDPVYLPARTITEEPIVLGEELEAAADRVARLVSAGIAVLITGETGVGKEVFARAVHKRSERATQPFIVLHCASPLDRGCLRTAISRAAGGSLFLDNVSDMPWMLQDELSRHLTEEPGLDVAICSAGRDGLQDDVANGVLRPQLYYRLAQYTLRLPTLAEQPNRRQIIERLWAAVANPDVRLADDARERLFSYDWPGNMRQLNGSLHALAALAQAGRPITISDLPEVLRKHIAGSTAPHDPPADDLQSIALDAMREALATCDGNVSRAARRLGIHRSTLYRRLLTAGSKETPMVVGDGSSGQI